MSDSPPVIYIQVYWQKPPRFRGKARRQPWRIRVIRDGNRKKLLWSESYTNLADAEDTARLIGSSSTTAFLQMPEKGNELLRQGS